MPKSSKSEPYINNPFSIASSGFTLLFSLARGVAIMLVVISVIGLFSGGWRTDSPDDTYNTIHNTVASWSTAEWSLAIGSILIIGLAIMMLSALFKGVSSYTSAQIARGNKVEIVTAFRVSFEHLWSYLWLQIIMFVKVVLWSMLFIIPGIIMAFRYSLAGTAFYDDSKQLRGNAAIKESLRLTKGAWLTTYAANTLFNILTLGAISDVVSTAVNAVLYQQFDKLGDKKPDAHWLSWLTLVLPFALIGIAIMFTVFIGVIIGLSGAS